MPEEIDVNEGDGAYSKQCILLEDITKPILDRYTRSKQNFNMIIILLFYEIEHLNDKLSDYIILWLPIFIFQIVIFRPIRSQIKGTAKHYYASEMRRPILLMLLNNRLKQVQLLRLWVTRVFGQLKEVVNLINDVGLRHTCKINFPIIILKKFCYRNE